MIGVLLRKLTIFVDKIKVNICETNNIKKPFQFYRLLIDNLAQNLEVCVFFLIYIEIKSPKNLRPPNLKYT